MTATAKAVRVAHFDLPALPFAYDALEPKIEYRRLVEAKLSALGVAAPARAPSGAPK